MVDFIGDRRVDATVDPKVPFDAWSSLESKIGVHDQVLKP